MSATVRRAVNQAQAELAFPENHTVYTVCGQKLVDVAESQELMNEAGRLFGVPERFMRNMGFSAITGCWLPVRYRNWAGYATIRDEGHNLLHRWMANHFSQGELQPEDHVDHLCRQRACNCPLHLEIVDGQENSHRMQKAKGLERALKSGQYFSGLEGGWLGRLVNGEEDGVITTRHGVYRIDTELRIGELLEDPAVHDLLPPGNKFYRMPEYQKAYTSQTAAVEEPAFPDDNS